MREKIIFVVSSNYQLMYAYSINKFLNKDYDTFLICSSPNKKIDQVGTEMGNNNSFSKVWTFQRLRKINSVGGFIDNISQINDLKKIIDEINPSRLIIFKDHDTFACSIIDYCKKKQTKIILIEEGLAIYNNKGKSKKNTLKNFIRKLVTLPKTYHVQGENPKVETIAASFPEMVPSSKRKGKTILSKPNCIPPENVIKELRFLFEIDKLNLNQYENCILFISQPLSELKIINEGFEAEIIEKISEKVKNTKIKLLVKPHPSENLNKYKNRNVTIIENNEIPVELLAMVLEPKAILTAYSSAAVNLSSWLNIPTIYLYNIFLKDSDFQISFGDIINLLNGQVIDNIDEIKEIIEEISVKAVRDEKKILNDDISFTDLVKNLIS